MQPAVKASFYWTDLPAGRALSVGAGARPAGFMWTGTISMSGKEFEEREAAEQRRDAFEADAELRERRAKEGLEYLEHAGDPTGQLEGDPFTRLVAGYQDLSKRATSANNPELHFQFGRQFLQIGMSGLAIEAFESALKIAPRWADAQYYYASALFAAGRLAEAEEEYEKARRLDPTMLEARVEHELLKIRSERARAARD